MIPSGKNHFGVKVTPAPPPLPTQALAAAFPLSQNTTAFLKATSQSYQRLLLHKLARNLELTPYVVNCCVSTQMCILCMPTTTTAHT